MTATAAQNIIRVSTNASRNRPAQETEYQVSISGNSITIYRDNRKTGEIERGSTFEVGDTAEYNSWDLSFLGTITKITQKAVTIVAYKGIQIETTRRLSLNEFCWRNFKFNLAEVTKQNAETSMYI